RSRIRCARNDSDVLPDHIVESKKLLAGLDQYTGAVCEHHAGKVHNLHARQRNCSRSALHVGGAVNNRIEPSALVYRHPFYRERHVQLRFKRSCNAFAKFDCVTDWPSLRVYVRERPLICPIGNSKRYSLVNDLQAAVTWLGKDKASGQGEASERRDCRSHSRNCRSHNCTAARLKCAPLRPTSRQSHSITSSAMLSSDGGTVRPIRRAVSALITSSNFVDCRTGKSAGFAPLRMRPA